jgi:hypothetical protein
MYALVVLWLASFGTSQVISFYYDSYCQDFGWIAYTGLNICTTNWNTGIHSATYSYTCDPDYYPVFTVYDSSNVSFSASFSNVTSSQFLGSFPLTNIIFYQQANAGLFSSDQTPIYTSSIQTEACISLGGSQYITNAELACAERNFTNPGPPKPSSSTSSSTPSVSSI